MSCGIAVKHDAVACNIGDVAGIVDQLDIKNAFAFGCQFDRPGIRLPFGSLLERSLGFIYNVGSPIVHLRKSGAFVTS